MKLSATQMDAMQELGNIGAAHAATTLSQMVSSPVEMSVPKIKVVDIAQLADHIGEESAALVVFELQGEIAHGGYILFYISRKSAVHLTNSMLGLTDPDRALNEMDESALLEVGNIMASAFLDATAELLGFVMLPSPPALTVDMAHAAVQSLIAQMQDEVNEIVLFSTELVCEEHKIDSDIIMMPEASMLATFVERLENLMKSS
ncbi:MAG TPA: chemotaxis protein CheC [Methanoregula sp.]|nr:chemotaxis protein CheC [Methanoregula sp.]